MANAYHSIETLSKKKKRSKYNKDHRYNLIPLCKKHHDLVHEGKLRINGFVMTDKGLELHYTEGE